MKYGHIEFDYASPIADELARESAFTRWVLEQTRFSAHALLSRLLVEQMIEKRTNSAATWWRSHFTMSCKCDGCRGGRETDLLAVFEGLNKFRFALHFEIKQPDDKPHKGQARRYALRSACWKRNAPPTIVSHDDSVTLLVCPRSMLSKNADELQLFDVCITWEDMKIAFPDIVIGKIANDPN